MDLSRLGHYCEYRYFSEASHAPYSLHELLKFKQNHQSCFQENSHIVFWGPFEGSLIFSPGMFRLTGKPGGRGFDSR
jgi:hypothetical protein